jgi:hypothetical protein
VDIQWKQVLNATEMGLYWKKMPTHTYISREKKPTSGFKAVKHCFTLLFGSNAGDVKLKPLLVYHSENPWVLRGSTRTIFPLSSNQTRKCV